MAELPFHECALARQEEASDARESLLASLDELRARADRFVTVVESAATLFAAFTRSAQAPSSRVDSSRSLPETIGSVNETSEHSVGSAPCRVAPANNGRVGHGVFTNGNGSRGYPDSARLGVVGDELTHPVGNLRYIPPAIVSPNFAAAKTRSPFSFIVTTMGCPRPSITKKGDLPDGFLLVDNGDGSATIAGQTERWGEFRIALKAKFGKGAGKYVAVQTFTLAVADGN